MPKKKKAKSRKKVDKWKAKKWYNVIPTDNVFPTEPIAQVISSNPENLVNRIVRVPLNMINGKATPLSFYTTVKLRINEVKGDNAYSYTIGHEVAMSYLRSLARRRRTVMHDTIKATTKDKKNIVIKTMVVTKSKVSEVVRKNLRKALWEKVKKYANSRDLKTLLNDTFNESFAKEIYSSLNSINPIEHVVVKKTELEESLK